MTETLATLVKTTREDRRLTQTALAERAGVAQGVISRIETGAYKETPPPTVLEPLARVLGVSQERMLRALGYMPERPGIAESAPAYDPADPREQLIARVRALRWSPGVERSLGFALGVIEAEQGMRKE